MLVLANSKLVTIIRKKALRDVENGKNGKNGDEDLRTKSCMNFLHQIPHHLSNIICIGCNVMVTRSTDHRLHVIQSHEPVYT